MFPQQPLVQLVRLLWVVRGFLLLGEVQVQAATTRVATTTHPVWVLSNGFHSAFALRISDAGPALRCAVRDPHAQWVLIGWGDKEFFMSRHVNPWTVIQAVFWPSPSALHVVPLRKQPELTYRRSDIVRLTLVQDNFSIL